MTDSQPTARAALHAETDDQLASRYALLRGLIENPDPNEVVAGIAPSVMDLLDDLTAVVREQARRQAGREFLAADGAGTIAPQPPVPAQPAVAPLPRVGVPEGNVYVADGVERHDRPHA